MIEPRLISRGGRVTVDRSHLHKGRPEKSLISRIVERAGRGRDGQILIRHRRSRAQRRFYRKVNFTYSGFQRARVLRFEYDPNRTAWISLVRGMEDARLHYILMIKGMEVGDIVESDSNRLGSRSPLNKLKIGTQVSSICLQPGGRSTLCRSAGTAARLIGLSGEYVVLELPSREKRLIHGRCTATVGALANDQHKLESKRRAGDAWRVGRRPRVRGMAMSASDHPMGGSSGRVKGHVPRDKWGHLVHGGKTRRNRLSDRFILSRRFKKR